MGNNYWKEYWAKNRERILALRKARYAEDKQYREGVIARAKERYWRKNAKKALVEKEIPKRIKESSRTLRPRVIPGPNGEAITVYHIAELGRMCRVSTETLRSWEERGIIPKATMIDEYGRRWYSREYMNTLASLVNLHWNSVRKLSDFEKLVGAEFAKSTTPP